MSNAVAFRLISTKAATGAAVLALAAIALPDAHAAVATCSGSGASFAGGSGTSADPFQVANQAQLEAIRSSTYRTCAFRQTANVSLSGSWTSIGTGASMFSGEYDGGGFAISNISMTSGSSYEGLFGYTGNGAILKNMRISGNVNLPGVYGVGGLVGLADRPTTITNVHSSVDVTAAGLVGGLVGWQAESTISKSSATGTVTGTNESVGGLVGLTRSSYGGISSSISDSYASGAVTGPSNKAGIAGLVGRTESGAAPYSVTISNSYAVGAVTGGTVSPGTTGGLIAKYSTGSPASSTLVVNGSFWDTETTGRATTADSKGTGKTTAEMKTLSTFSAASWDISNGWEASKFWGICEGTTYPFLTGQYTAGTAPCLPPAPPSPTPTPDPAPTPDPLPTPDPSPIPDPSPGPGPTPEPEPSNAFTMRSPQALGSIVVTAVKLPGPGTVILKATRSGNAAAQLTACRSSRSVSRARAVVLRCTADSATRSAQRRGDVRVRVTVTYTPNGGSARTSSPRTVVLKRLRPAFTG